ncbi:EcsC family protein [soil metagenome]
MPGITDQIADSFVQQLARGALEGVGPLSPAREIAEEALAQHTDREAAIDEVVRDHTRMAAANGFVTGLGGFVMLPIAVPANVLGFYTLSARMVAAIAHIRGHDIAQPESRVAVLAALTGDDVGKLLGKAGVVMPAGGLTSAFLRRMAPSTTTMVNKAIGFRLLVGTGERALVKLGRAIPLAGGVIGGALDVTLIRSIAKHARRVFPTAAHDPITVESSTGAGDAHAVELSNPAETATDDTAG